MHAFGLNSHLIFIEYWKGIEDWKTRFSPKSKFVTKNYCHQYYTFFQFYWDFSLLANPGKLVQNFSQNSLFRVISQTIFWKTHPDMQMFFVYKIPCFGRVFQKSVGVMPRNFPKGPSNSSISDINNILWILQYPIFGKLIQAAGIRPVTNDGLVFQVLSYDPILDLNWKNIHNLHEIYVCLDGFPENLNFSFLSRAGLDKARWKIFKSRAKEVENPVI